jgi:enoyl reductase
MSKAVVFERYGPPEVLHLVDLEPPNPNPSEVRVQVKSAGVQPFDCLFRAGGAHQWLPAAYPQQLGNEFAGIIDAVGSEVTGCSVGDEVLGWAVLKSHAEHVLVAPLTFVKKPDAMPWPEAGVLSASGQTAATAVAATHLARGDTVVVHAASGGVGSFAVQLARGCFLPFA